MRSRWNSPPKNRIRVELYKRARKLMGAPMGNAVVLAGDGAMEVELLRDYLKWDARRVLFVDRYSVAGLRRAKRSWPEVNTYYGWLHDAVEGLGPIGFANLDFMGFMTKNTERAIRAVGKKLLPGAVVSYTFSQTRENDVHSSWATTKKVARRFLPKEHWNDFGLLRWVGYSVQFHELLGRRDTNLASLMYYRPKPNTGVALGVVMVQHAPSVTVLDPFFVELILNPASTGG